jgi:hypothetical protein
VDGVSGAEAVRAQHDGLGAVDDRAVHGKDLVDSCGRFTRSW